MRSVSLALGYIYLVAATGLALAAPVPSWPQFRGPGGNSVAVDQTIPVEFGPNKNLRWKIATPIGHSSPCIWGDRLFLTGHNGPILKMLCYRRSDGKLLWEKNRSINRIPVYEHVAGDPSNPTPATNGRQVVFVFDDYGVVALDLEGNDLWEKQLAPTGNSYSYGASPVIDDDRVYLNRDGGLDSSLLCLDAATGESKWRTERTPAVVSFCTPYVWSDGGRKLLLAGGSGRLEAYEPDTGTPVWKVTGLPFFVCPSPVAGGGLVFWGGWTTAHVAGRSRVESAFGEEVALTPEEAAQPKAFLDRFDRNHDGRIEANELPPSRARDAFNFLDKDKNGYVEKSELEILFSEGHVAPGRNVVVAVAGGGRGDVTKSHVKWEMLKGLPYVASPLYHRGRVYLAKTGGFFTCLEAATGKALYESERLGVAGEYYATPVAVGDRLVLCAERGTVLIVKAGDTFEVLARNEIGDGIAASPAVVDNTLYVRGDRFLWAFGK